MATKDSAPPAPKQAERPPRPHWTTYIAPACSAIAAIAACVTTWIVFDKTVDMNQRTLRPLVAAKFTQTTIAGPMHTDGGAITGLASLSGQLRGKNSGKTPAYDIQYNFQDKDKHRFCVAPASFTLASDEVRGSRLACMTEDGYLENLSGLTLKRIKGTVTYKDGFGQNISEEAGIQLRIGQPLNRPFFELNSDPQPDF